MTSDRLVPVLSQQERDELIAYNIVVEKYSDEYYEATLEKLLNHPVYSKIVKAVSTETFRALHERTTLVRHDAIHNDNWRPFLELLRQQATSYAQLGIEFRSWHELLTMVRNFIIPNLCREYKDEKKLIASLAGMNRYMDICLNAVEEFFNEGLEKMIAQRTAQFEAVNKELESFTYSVSHDLRAPLRAVHGYSEMLAQGYRAQLDEEGKRLLSNIGYYTNKMATLIDDLLAFSHLGRKELVMTHIDMNELVNKVITEIARMTPHRAQIELGNLHMANADQGLVYQVLTNLISNAVKYSAKKSDPKIEITSYETDKQVVYSVRDNGAGFEMKYVSKLFGVFQRLHSDEEFDGTGVGLAIVQRVIARHNGQVWADSKVNEGAVFYFSLSKP